MDTLRKLVLAFGAALIVMVLAVGPAVATEAGGGEAPAETATTEGETHDEPGIVVRNEDGKMVLPLDPQRPRDVVGIGILAFVALGILLGLVNAGKQLRGERGQATGEWRYR